MLRRNLNSSLPLCAKSKHRLHKIPPLLDHRSLYTQYKTVLYHHNSVVKVFSAFNGKDGSAAGSAPKSRHERIPRRRSSGHPRGQGIDKDLIKVLELATDDELEALHKILFGLSVLSPVIKSVDRSIEDLPKNSNLAEDRALRLRRLERRFRYLAADALGTLQGKWPSYRECLLNMRTHLGVACSSRLATHDLEAEIFLHLVESQSIGNADDRLLQTKFGSYSSNATINPSADSSSRIERSVKAALESLENGLVGSLQFGASELLPAISKVGVTFAITRLWNNAAVKLATLRASTAAYSVGGASVLGAVLARSMLSFVGSTLWISTAFDLARISIGTDYGRIVRAVFLLAQIRLIRTSGWI